MPGKGLCQVIGVLDMVHGHGAHDDIVFFSQWFLGDVLADRLHLALQFRFCNEFFQHRLGNIDGGNFSNLRCHLAADQSSASTKVHYFHVRVKIHFLQHGRTNGRG